LKRRDLISIGKVVNTHGIHGKLRVVYYNEDKANFFSYRRVLLEELLGRLEPFEVTEAKIHGKFLIVHFRGLNSLDEAERLIGAALLVERASLPRLEEGEYYWADLIGMEVTSDTGDRLGEILGILPTGGTDVLIVRMGENEVLIPATEEVIKQVDTVSRRMVIHLVKGLTADDPV
jgi:16S rRNA processing protein RimM